MDKKLEETVRTTAMSDAIALLELLTQFPRKDIFAETDAHALTSDLRSISEEADLAGESLSRVFAEAEALEQSFDSESLDYEILRREHTRLFDHPEHPAVFLYESQFLFQEQLESGSREAAAKQAERPRSFVNAAALDAEREYRQAGLERRLEMNVPADTMYTEMAFMSTLFYRRSEALVNGDAQAIEAIDAQIAEFKHYHLDKWMDAFYRRCEEESSVSLYRMLGAFGQAVYAAL